MGALLALVAAVTFGWLSFPIILGIGALFGLGAVGAESAQVVAAGRLAGSDQIARVYARLQSVDSSAAIAVPVLAALILGWSSHVFAWSVLVLALISLVLGLLIRTNPTGDKEASAEEQGTANDSLGRGLREIWVNTPLRTITIITILTNSALATASAIESVLFLTHMGVSASVYAIFTGIAGFAALLGSLIATRIIDRLGKEKTVFFGYGLLAVAALFLIIPSVAPVTWGLVAAQHLGKNLQRGQGVEYGYYSVRVHLGWIPRRSSEASNSAGYFGNINCCGIRINIYADKYEKSIVPIFEVAESIVFSRTVKTCRYKLTRFMRVSQILVTTGNFSNV